MKMGDPKEAKAHADKVLASEGGETKIVDKILSGAMLVKGDALVSQKKSMAAVEAYQKLLSSYEEKMPLASVRYKVGQILFEQGDMKGAADVWKRLEGTTSEFLYKVGKEKLEDTKWKSDYRKYVNRIPAMAKESP
jgi:predicted negative regulator of RcsB-dependent stress response